MHAAGILSSLDESRYSCIMARNKEISQKEKKTKTQYLFVPSVLNWIEPRKLLSAIKTSYLSVLAAKWNE